MTLAQFARVVLAVVAMIFAITWSPFAQGPGTGPAPAAVPGCPGLPPPSARPFTPMEVEVLTTCTHGGRPIFMGPVVALSPAEQAKRFWLPQGYRIEAVVSEPHVIHPGQIAFDGNGRMFVAELNTYMQDMEATGQLDPKSRITVHEDRDDDGIYETHGVFVDGLAFPRWVLPFGANAILTNEATGDETWKFTDTDNDGRADKKELFAIGFGRLTNVEFQQSGLTWALDNWMYSTVNQFRVRWTPRGVVREPTSRNGGQWGVTMDSYGKIYFQNGSGGMPMDFQATPVYGTFAYPDEYAAGTRTVWGAANLALDFDPENARPEGAALISVTGGAGNDIYRGDRLPKDLVGDYLYGEVAGRLVRRLRPVNVEGMTQLRTVYAQAEFIASTDPVFRPVDLATAPDGTLYIADLYHGVAQEAQFAGPGSYKRARFEQLGLQKIIQHGRIWRVSYDGIPRDTRKPRMLTETAAQLVAHLSHPNGWWRDTAQQLLVLKQDKSVVPALRKIALSSAPQLGRIHALWTLEGLESLEAVVVRSLMKDPDPQIRIQAIRASETLYKAGDRSFAADYRTFAGDRDVNVVVQALLTLNILKVADTTALIKSTMAGNPAKGVQIIGAQLLAPATGRGGGTNIGGDPVVYTPEEQAVMTRGQTIYTEICYACHGNDGRGASLEGAAPGVTRAPSLVGSPRVLGHRDYVIHGLLKGITGPVDGRQYAEVMIPMGSNPDEWIAAVSSYVRNSWGNRAAFVGVEDVARARAAAAGRTSSWTVAELEARLPKPLVVDARWKFTASHNETDARRAVGLAPWTTGAPQRAGMYLQVELPQPVMLTELQFEAPAPAGRGGGGRGRAGAAAGAGPTPVVGYPRGYRVQTSMDGTIWSAAVAEGEGTGRVTLISFAPVRAKFVRITQTATAASAPAWSVTQLRLYEAGQSAGR